MSPAPGGRLVRVSWVPVRSEPSHRAEMVTQWLCGEVLVPLEERGSWVRVRGPDGYAGWCEEGGLVRVGVPEAAAWAREATLYSLGVALSGPAEGETAAPWPRWLPWGARAAPAGRGRARLPDGREALPVDPGRLVDPATLRRMFPAEETAVAATADTWAGAPYLWGGRTRGGADCSGFVQAVFAAHGIGLPRDSRDQLAAGPAVEEAAADAGARRPADLLFFGASRSEITHVALSLGGTLIVHAAAGKGGVTADDLEALPAVLADLGSRLAGVTRPLAGAPGPGG